MPARKFREARDFQLRGWAILAALGEIDWMAERALRAAWVVVVQVGMADWVERNPDWHAAFLPARRAPSHRLFPHSLRA